MTMKKLRLSRETVYVLGLVLQAFAVSLMTKADLGLSQIVAPAYILSCKASFLSFGQAEYIVQGALVLLLCILTKKIRFSYLFTFVTVFIYGAVLDFFNWLWQGFSTPMWARILLFITGMLLTALSVALFFHTYLSPAAYDFFVKQVALAKQIDISKFKLAFDAVFLSAAVVLSLLFFKKLVGVSAGTVVMALLNGHIIRFFSKQIERHTELFDRFPKLANYFE